MPGKHSMSLARLSRALSAINCAPQRVATGTLGRSRSLRAGNFRPFASSSSAITRDPVSWRGNGVHPSFPTVRKHALASSFHSSSLLADVIPFKLADIGEGIAEVEVLQWFIKEGDEIKEFDKVCEVQSDKASVEITSRYAGKVTKIYYDVGDIAAVGGPLIDIETSSSSAPAAPTPAPASTSSTSAPSTSQQGGGNIVEFKLADIGEGIAEVELLQWFVKEGDKVKQFDKVCEVQSDKATVEITSRYDGTVRTLRWDANQVVPVGSVLFDIDVGGSPPASSSAPTRATPSPAASSAKSPPTTSTNREAVQAANDKVLTTPAVRRIARENNVDLGKVIGTGPKGRILKGDVLKFVAEGGQSSQSAGEQTVSSIPATSRFTPQPPVSPIVIPTPPPVNAPSVATQSPPVIPQRTLLTEDEVIPIRGIQRMMVKSMTAALKVPHFYFGDEVEMNKVSGIRKDLKALAQARGVKLTYLPFIIKAASLALVQHPNLNATVNDDCSEITVHKDHNISLAVDTPRGLLVPNIKQVQFRSLLEIAEEINRLQALGVAGKLGEYDLNGGTFSISNMGAIGGTVLGPVIMVPQVAIGAVGRIQKVPRFDENGGVKAVELMNISWAGDHRVIDGATMARFSNLWRSYLQEPMQMLAELR